MAQSESYLKKWNSFSIVSYMLFYIKILSTLSVDLYKMILNLKIPHASRVLGSRGDKFWVEEAGGQGDLIRSDM